MKKLELEMPKHFYFCLFFDSSEIAVEFVEKKNGNESIAPLRGASVPEDAHAR